MSAPVALSLSSMIMPGAVFAQEALTPDQTMNWGGLYLGAALGKSISGITTFSATAPDFSNADYDYTAFAGYSFKQGNLVLGPEVSLNLKTFTTNASNIYSVGGLSMTNQTDVTIDKLIKVNGRFGVQMNNWLPYVTAGYATAKVTSKVTTSLTGGAITSGPHSTSSRHHGVNIGVGLERRILGNMIIGVEASRTELLGRVHDYGASSEKYSVNVNEIKARLSIQLQ